MKGYFLAIEGPDGSGKSTLCKLLEDYFIKNKIDVLLTREPGGTKIGEDIRKILLDKTNTNLSPRAEALLYASARAQHIGETIRPKLDKSFIVICDRFLHSSFAYQGYGRGLNLEDIKLINDFAIEGTYPDRIIYLDMDPAEALDRNKKAQKTDRMEEESLSFHKKVNLGFKKSLQKYNKNVKCIDASQDIESVYDDALKIILEDLNEINNCNYTR